MPSQKTIDDAIRRKERQLVKQILKMKHSLRQSDKNAAFDEIERLTVKLNQLQAIQANATNCL